MGSRGRSSAFITRAFLTAGTVLLYNVIDGIAGKEFRFYNPGFFDSGYGTEGGEYRINNLPAGEYIVTTNPSSNPDGVYVVNRSSTLPTPGSSINVRTFHPSSLDVSSATSFVLKPGEEARGKDIQIRQGTVRKISGRVINSLPRIPELSRGGPHDLLDYLDSLTTGAPLRAGSGAQAADAEISYMALV